MNAVSDPNIPMDGIVAMNEAANDLAVALGLPVEAKYDLIDIMFGESPDALTVEEESKAVVCRYLGALEEAHQGPWALDALMETIDALFSPDFADHGRLMGQTSGREGFKEGVRLLFQAFPELRFQIDLLTVQDNRVAYAFYMSGEHKGEFRGFQPNKRPNKQHIETMGTTIYVVANGKIVERTGVLKEDDIWEQLGLNMGQMRRKLQEQAALSV